MLELKRDLPATLVTIMVFIIKRTGKIKIDPFILVDPVSYSRTVCSFTVRFVGFNGTGRSG